MRIISIEDSVNHDLYLKNIIALKQVWQNQKTFSYMSVPRPDSGIIMILTEGAEYFCSGGGCIRPAYGDVLYIPEGIHYLVKFNENNAKTLLLNFSATDKRDEKVIFAEGISTLEKNAENKYVESFLEMCDIYTQRASNKLILKSKLYAVINELANDGIDRNGGISEAVELINSNLTGGFKISELARMCAMSESTFRREFKKSMGMSPVKYITAEKLKKAKQMLKSTTLTTYEIGMALEFYDNAYFCRVFKEFYKITPTQYRKKFADLE